MIRRIEGTPRFRWSDQQDHRPIFIGEHVATDGRRINP